MKNPHQFFSLLVMAALVLIPVSVTGLEITNSTNTTNTTVITTATETIVTPEETSIVSNETTVPATATATATASPTTAIPTTTAMVTTTNTTVYTTTVAPTSTTTVTDLPASVGTVSFTSSPIGAYVLIDGVFSGNTPVNLTSVAEGNHIVRLTLSGYYDYEGTMYVVPGKVTSVFGTLPPLGSAASSDSTTAAVTTTGPVVTMQTTAASSAGIFDNPTVIAAFIGVLTATIGAGATIYSHYAKLKKD
jgi:hypothetical protein